ncbi:MAG: phosphoglycerate dehydrogenase [Clostridium sp.]|jgi:D-3-phosphoglycerate dehydrogenase|nr:phosphoglycerate dehydrogenase [Clostridium sp.]MBP3215062.1 phosphoglycerate dehydrogenase [Clostridium sp.]MBQ5420952.1 phosphoglycerate dehydrogenase [Clostridium sp.]
MRRVVCLNAISPKGLELLPEGYEVSEKEVDADAILVRSASMHDMKFSKSLRCIARAGAGVNNIPLERCAEEGIVVFNTPGANANAVKEMVIAGILLAARDIPGGMQWCLENKEDPTIGKDMEKAKKAFAGHEIIGKKLGVIGLGAIGAEVANAAAALGMEVYGYDPFISVNSAWNLARDVKHINTVDTIYRECDYITVHVPAMDSTKGMIDKKALDEMKDGVVIINMARDLLVNDDDMAEALMSGKVKRYVTDFPNEKVMHMKNVIATPHLGASTEEAEDNCAMAAVREMVDYLENGNILNSVNFPNCDMGVCETKKRIAILNENVPNIISQVSFIFSAAGINIANMTNKSKGRFAYTMMDLDTDVPDVLLQRVRAINGVCRVRVIK